MKNLKSLDIYRPQQAPHFVSNMREYAPFVRTWNHLNCFLTDCVIQTESPHLVARLHIFRTNPKQVYNAPDSDARNDRYQDFAAEQEDERLQYLYERTECHAQPSTMPYDMEHDEPRLLGKVPGMDVYLELVGSLDNITLSDLRPGQAERILKDMTIWFPNSLQRKDIEMCLTSPSEPQPIEAWRATTWDPRLRPLRPAPIGFDRWENRDPDRCGNMMSSKESFRDDSYTAG